MYCIHTNSLLHGLSINIKHAKVSWADTMQADNKFENLKFLSYFFNKDTSFNISLKFLTHEGKGLLEGSVSQSFEFGRRFYAMPSRKKYFIKRSKLLIFCKKIKTKP